MELCIDIANIQSEINGVINRIKFVKRLINKNKTETREVEELDSSFKTNVKI